jgi:hypothetical protein
LSVHNKLKKTEIKMCQQENAQWLVRFRFPKMCQHSAHLRSQRIRTYTMMQMMRCDSVWVSDWCFGTCISQRTSLSVWSSLFNIHISLSVDYLLIGYYYYLIWWESDAGWLSWITKSEGIQQKPTSESPISLYLDTLLSRQFVVPNNVTSPMMFRRERNRD